MCRISYVVCGKHLTRIRRNYCVFKGVLRGAKVSTNRHTVARLTCEAAVITATLEPLPVGESGEHDDNCLGDRQGFVTCLSADTPSFRNTLTTLTTFANDY